jgi:RNA polymerase sigma-70 factor (ECF subfamily)
MKQFDSDYLLQELKAGDERAFEWVFKTYYSGLCVYALKYLGDAEMARDVVSQFFCTFFIKRQSLSINSSLKAYLFRSVRNAAYNYLRDHQKERGVVHDQEVSLRPLYSNDSVHDTLIGKELEDAIDAIVNALPEQCRFIFEKSRQEGMKYREIAEELNLSIHTVETQMSRALRKLREGLKDYLVVFFFLG